jgi:hypothetical protein
MPYNHIRVTPAEKSAGILICYKISSSTWSRYIASWPMFISYSFILCCVTYAQKVVIFVTVLKWGDYACVGLPQLMGPLSSSQMMHEWIWSSREIILTGRNRRTRRKSCPSVTLSTNPTWIVLDANPGLRGGKPATNRLSCGTARHSGAPVITDLRNNSYASVHQVDFHFIT